MKKSIISLTVVLLSVFLYVGIGQAVDPVKVRVNGEKLDFPADHQPRIEQNRTLIPVSFIGQKLGMQVNWNQAERKVTVQAKNQIIKLWIGQSKAVINGREIKLKVAPRIINKRSYIPISLLEKFDYLSVKWAESTRTVKIHDWSRLDYGLYWYGKNDRRQKYIPGQKNRYFDPEQPTVIYMHGWSKGAVVNKQRVSFNYRRNDSEYGKDINTINAWIENDWNIGVFYWRRFADEAEVKDAEAKIWSVNGPKGIRWRSYDGDYKSGPDKNVGQLFYEQYKKCFSNYQGGKIRIVGHSLGNQLAVKATQVIVDNVEAGNLSTRLRPNRVALLDPFWSKDKKDYLKNNWVGERVRSIVRRAFNLHGTVFEYYKSTPLNDLGIIGIGDRNLGLENLTALVNLAPWYIPPEEVEKKHLMVYNWYFWSYSTNPPEELAAKEMGVRFKPTGRVAASASTPNQRIFEMMGNKYEWVQIKGRDTADPADDKFERKKH